MIKIGHRGAKGHVAENTMASIQRAMDLGVDGIEIDVHLCGSGELVVFHDATLDRMTNGTGAIGRQPLSELQKLNVHGGHKIPTLEEVLNLLDRKCLLNIELKGKNTASKTCELIQSYVHTKGWNYQDFIVSSFQHRELETVHATDGNIPLGVLTKASIAEAIAFAQTVQAVAIHPNHALLTSENVQRSQKEGFKVLTWTVNDPDTIERMKAYHVDGIISDMPDRL